MSQLIRKKQRLQKGYIAELLKMWTELFGTGTKAENRSKKRCLPPTNVKINNHTESEYLGDMWQNF